MLRKSWTLSCFPSCHMLYRVPYKQRGSVLISNVFLFYSLSALSNHKWSGAIQTLQEVTQIFVGLWTAKEKPIFNIFLRPLTKELKKLCKGGLDHPRGLACTGTIASEDLGLSELYWNVPMFCITVYSLLWASYSSFISSRTAVGDPLDKLYGWTVLTSFLLLLVASSSP